MNLSRPDKVLDPIPLNELARLSKERVQWYRATESYSVGEIDGRRSPSLQNSASAESDGLAANNASGYSECAEDSQAELLSPAAQESDEAWSSTARERGRPNICRMQTIVFWPASSPGNLFSFFF